MVLDVHIEITPVPVCHKRRVGQSVRELRVYGLLASRLHLIYIGEQVVLEYPVPVQLFPDSGTGLVGSHHRGALNPLAYFFICRIGLGTVFLEHILHGALADFLARQVRDKFGYPLERDALHDIEVSHERTDVVAVLDTVVGGIAVVHAAALADLLVILVLTGLDDKLEVYDLSRADLPVSDTSQRTAAALAVERLMLYYPVWCSDRLQGASLVARLTATRLSAGFAVILS